MQPVNVILSTVASSVILALPIITLAGATTAPTTVPTIDLSAGSFPGAPPSVSVADVLDVVREGTHFVSRIATLSHTPDNQQAILSFDNKAGLTNSPPMIVLPNLNLFMMESVTAGRTTQVEFRISGTVTEYKAKNYIIIDSVQTALKPQAAASTPQGTGAGDKTSKDARTSPAGAAEQPAASTSTAPSANVMGDSARRKMNHLLAQLPDTGAALPTTYDNTAAAAVINRSSSGFSTVAPDAPAMKLLREGTHLIDRVGRLNHSPDGKQAFFTYDSDGKAMQDTPLIILPNLKLTAMEGVVAGKSSDVHFRISGTLTEYHGRNYILLNKAIAIADAEVPF